MKTGLFWKKATRKSSRWRQREEQSIASFPLGPFDASLQQNAQDIKTLLGSNLDFTTREMIGGSRRVMLFFYQTLVDVKKLTEFVIVPLQQRWEQGVTRKDPSVTKDESELHPLRMIEECIIPSAGLERVGAWPEAVQHLLFGKVLLLLDGESTGLLIEVKQVAKRAISPPDTEQSVIGPRESFVEDLETNLALIRQRLRDPNLMVESVNITGRSKTKIAVLYVSDIANPAVVGEVKRRLSQIDTDAFRGHMQLQEMLEDNTWSLFPQMRPTERPDVTCSYLLEGSVAILSMESAHALIVPVTFFQLLDTVDDYYSTWQYATLIRFVRLIALLLSIATPGLYLALVAYNPELIPTRLVISMDAARVRVALPIVLEIFAMEVMIEILREAGIKLPRPIGQAVSIIGGLVIGEAAVNANLVSPVTVVIVALTAISSFTAPVYMLGITYRILRFFLLFVSSVLGLYGFLLGLFLIHSHACKLVSFGVPYLAPLSPMRLPDWADTVIRLPFKKLNRRPTFLRPLQMTKGKALPMRLSALLIQKLRVNPLAPNKKGGSDENA